MESTVTSSDLTSGKNVPIWYDESTKIPQFPKLDKDIEVDVCIIGGGIAGLTLAYTLTKEGKTIALLEDGLILSGETGRTSAHLMTSYDDRYYSMKQKHGSHAVKLLAESQVKAIDFIENVIKTEQIECDFRRVNGYLFLAEEHKKSHPEMLDEEFKVSKECGLDVRMVERAPFNDFDTGKAILYANNGQFDAVKYLCGVARTVHSRGGLIFQKTHAKSYTGGKGKDSYVEVDEGFRVKCSYIALCTNNPINHTVSFANVMESDRTYMICAKVPKDYLPQILLWDTLDKYHYVRLQYLDDKVENHNILMIGGEDHRVGEQHADQDFIEKKYDALEKWARERFPQMGEIVSKWSGQVQEPIDGLPLLGHHGLDEKNVLVITGDSGQGMTNTTVGAILLTDIIMGRSNEWEKVFNPSRIPKGLGGLIRHSAETFKEYMMWLSKSDVPDIEDILPDHGAIVRRGLTKHACYRNLNGELFEMSAVCTHLGGEVRWNQSERTFDCPCHGSKFDKFGKVITGPANLNLPAISDNVKLAQAS